jgi:FkbM family methyltransferase
MLRLHPIFKNEKAERFCESFLESNRPKYIFGCTEWSDSIAESIPIDGFIDDFTSEKTYKGKPIVPIEDIPDDSLVVSVVQGKPFVAERRLKCFQFDSLDYFSFFAYSKLSIKPVMFWEGMAEDISNNFQKYDEIYNLLNDKTSKNQFYNIVNFRLSYDLDFMRGFENIEERQYFETFFELQEGEVFVDIGAYDGFTTKVFVDRCPGYKKVFVFEPERHNMEVCKRHLNGFRNIAFIPLGLSHQKASVKFSPNGSSSKITENGTDSIEVGRLDDIINEKVTFIKMDIEGYEQNALQGARETIRKYHPKLAISVYHRKDDLWKIPEIVFQIRRDYDIYLRHYTEGISETIMYFIPTKK